MKSLQQQLQEAYLGMKGILSEEDEQFVTEILALDELSKETLGRYISKAVDDVATKAQKSGAEKVGGMPNLIHVKAAAKRIRGINKATEKLTKEEFEETLDEMLELLDEEALTELSKKTLGSYINKAANSAALNYGKHTELKAGSDEVDRFANRHMKHGARGVENIKSDMGVSSKDVAAPREKAIKRIHGITQATKRLTKEQKELIGSILEELMDESDSFENEISESFESAAKKALQLHGKADKTEAEHKRLKYHLDNANRDKMFLKSKDIIKHKDLLDKIRAISKD